MVCCVFSLESPYRTYDKPFSIQIFNTNEYTQYTILNTKKKITHKYLKSAMGNFFHGTLERVQKSRGKRAISVRATEGLP